MTELTGSPTPNYADGKSRTGHLAGLETALATAKYAPKADNIELSVAELLDTIEASHKQLGEDIAVLRQRVAAQANLILELIRTTSK